ncbi:EmrB/QacA subfamily drug resistance transporter [Catenulispora sp. MAP12-49]|uniref:DHA2 family efflux MFS transporter permease subunit n=1 Tax=Catenulispora sp. MAP12-49 TaxID=3156302 RepID=UPI0035155B47
MSVQPAPLSGHTQDPSSTTSAPPPPTARPAVRPVSPAVVTAVGCIAQFMIVLDSTIVTVALPAMRSALNLSATSQQWVVNGYLIALGGLLLLAARLGDLFGHARMLRVGVVLFTLASLVGGFAPNGACLIAARVVQGVGAAIQAPTGLSLINTALHDDPPRRAKAVGLWSMIGGFAGAAGVVLGGVLTEYLDWRWVLFVNVPIGVGLYALCFRGLPSAPRGTRRSGLDLPGALTVTVASAALAYGASQASADGWGSATVLTALIGAAVLYAAFALFEVRSPRPLVPPAFIRLRGLVFGNFVALCLGASMTSGMVFISIYLQQTLGFSALRTGMCLLPMTAALVAGGLLARRLVATVGPRVLVPVGSLVTAAGQAWTAFLPDHSAYASHVLGPTVVIGLGVSCTLLGVTVACTAGIAPQYAGSAAGLLNTARQLGGAIGLAALSTIALTAAAHDHAAGPLDASVHGLRVALLTSAAVMVVAAAGSLALPRRSAAGR